MLDHYGVEAEHPDEFVLHLLEVDARSVISAVVEQLAALTQPPHTVPELLDSLARRGMPKSARALRDLEPRAGGLTPREDNEARYVPHRGRWLSFLAGGLRLVVTRDSGEP